MSKSQALEKLMYKSKRFLRGNSATILTYVGAAGVVGTAITTVKATTKAVKLIEERKYDKGEDLTKLEVVQATWSAYVPPMVFGVATISCIFGANILNKRHQASLASAYALANTSFKEYRNKLKELYGDEMDSEIEEAIYEDKYLESDNSIRLFYDHYSQRYFESTMEKVQRAEYHLNREFIMKDYAYLNEFYELLGIPAVENGWKLGWSTAACFDMYWQSWIDFSHSDVMLDDGRECRYIYMFQEPIEGFEDY